MQKIITFSLFIFITLLAHSEQVIDRYIKLADIATEVQKNPMNVIVNIDFPNQIFSVKNAIENLLIRSGYKLSDKYEAYAMSKFELPQVHRKLGPIKLIDAIKTLVGKGRLVSVNHFDRVVKVSLTHIAVTSVRKIKSINENKVKQGLDEVIKVQITNEPFLLALKKILPQGWEITINQESIKDKYVTLVSEDKSVEQIITKIAKSAFLEVEFYKKMKILVLSNHE